MGGTVFAFRRLRIAIAQVASSLVGKYSPAAFICIPAVSLRVSLYGIYFFVLCIRSGGGRLLVCFVGRPRRGEIYYEDISPSVFYLLF